MSKFGSLRDLPISEDTLAENPGLVAEMQTVTPSKYHNARTDAHGMTFASGKEAAGVGGLILLEKQKKIFGLRLQVGFPLPGKNWYRADAVYSEIKDGRLQVIVRDFKGFETPGFKVKARAFEAHYGIKITVE